ncbi:MAG TPA: TonB-dependent receptor [Steroidobacteraceae bacterium]
MIAKTGDIYALRKNLSASAGGARKRVGAGALTLLTAMGMQFAHAAEPETEAAANTPAAAQGGLDEVVVTGSRIIRDGYEAPTPLTVVGAEQMQQQAAPNVIDYLTSLPAFSGNYTPQGSTQNVSTGTAGTSSVNLRNLGTNRTLVLIDGQRSVPSTVTGLVDINTIPQQLIERVEVVTGGASAAYGSDAVSGVVNFILDKKFTGFKSEVSGGGTDYGDNGNYKVAMTFGTGFASDRGHLIVSGQVSGQDGVLTGDRPWNTQGWQIITNPAYAADHTQPQRILASQIAPGNATPGGIFVSGYKFNPALTKQVQVPVPGIAFGQGGTPYLFNYGPGYTPLGSGTPMQGGAWQDSSLHVVGQSIEPKMDAKNVFARLSYDVTDNIQAYVQSNWYENSDISHAYPNEFFGGLSVSVDNPFLPADVANQIRAQGLDHIVMGTTNGDIGTVTIDTSRKVVRNVVGLTGKLDMFNTDWSWDAYFQGGVAQSSENAYNSVNINKFTAATDAIVDPNSGAIVCRNGDPTCVPYNLFGIGVNSAAAVDYVTGRPHREQTFRENVWAASLNGSPFASWAGPVSMATGIEHRTESVRGSSTAEDQAGVYFAGNYLPTFGHYDVTEGFFETVVPLAAKLPFAESLDLNAAVRYTDYSISGDVTTWKIGATWRPIDDVMVRVTRSRDIRAPNLNELFNAGSKVQNLVVDNVSGQTVAYEGTTSGNLALTPEKADSTGFGIVYQPSFVPGLSASVDYWNIDLKDAINTISAQQIVDACQSGNQDLCQAINGGAPLDLTKTGGSAGRNAIAIKPFNLAQQLVRGIDYEASYRSPMSIFSNSLSGDFMIRLLATNFLKNYTDNTVSLPLDVAGQNTAGTGSTPDWRWTASFTYNLEPFSATLAARGVSAGTYGNNFIECSSGCPVSTIDHPTINDNHIPGATYLDLSLSYTMLLGKDESTQMQTFFNIRNITNKDPVIVAGGPSGLPYDTVTTNPANYDSLGRVYMAGVRIKM